MKRHIFFWCIAAIALLASCAAPELDLDTQTPDVETEKSEQIITITAVEALPEGDTKAIHGTEADETSFSWQAGIDKIGVIKRMTEYGEDQAYWGMDHHRFTNTKDGSIATFAYDMDDEGEGLVWGDPLTLEVGEKIVAYYPYATAASSWYDSSQPYLMSSHGALVQRGDNNTEHLFRGDYMFSKVITLEPEHFDADGNVNLTIEFGHIFSKMRFSVKNSTSEPLDISSLIYRSTKEDDVMQGTLILDAATGELSSEGLGDWGMVPPMNSAVLEVEGVSVAPGETATLWMWMLPLDFTAGNPDGRMADIMVNTNKGVFRVENKTFSSKFEPGQVYRQGLELTSEKLLEDFAYISDHNFARILYEGDVSNQYDEETGDWIGQSHVTLYDMNFQPFELTCEEDLWIEEFPLRGGSFIKLSEAAQIESLYVSAGQYNALSFDGLQYFTNLKSLTIDLGSDMNPTLTMRALKLQSLTKLEKLVISNPIQIPILDVSNNINLKTLDICTPKLERLIGLEKLTKLEEFNIAAHKLDKDVVLNLTNSALLKNLYVPENVKVNISGLNLDLLSVGDARNVISDGMSCKELYNGMGYPFPSGAPGGVESLELNLYQGDGQPSMFSQFADMTDITEMKLWFGCAGNDYEFTSAQSSLKTLDIYQVNEPISAIPCPTGWSNLTGVETLFINKDVYYFEDLWNFTEASPLDLSGMTSLNFADIRVNKLESFAVPASLKSLELSTKSAVSFAPTGVEELNLDAQGKQITLGDSQSLKTVTLYAGADGSANAITIGSCPNLEELIINVSGGKLLLGGTSYPMLKTFRIAKGKHISTIPSATVFPALEVLSISGSGYGSRDNGIGTLDATQYTNLKQLYIGGLDDGYAYRNYNNRYYNGNNYYIRSKGSFVISEAQFNAAKAYAKANSDREIFSGISGFENAAWDESSESWVDIFQYKVNSIYKVVDVAGNEIPIADTDYTDGECTSIVNSTTN